MPRGVAGVRSAGCTETRCSQTPGSGVAGTGTFVRVPGTQVSTSISRRAQRHVRAGVKPSLGLHTPAHTSGLDLQPEVVNRAGLQRGEGHLGPAGDAGMCRRKIQCVGRRGGFPSAEQAMWRVEPRARVSVQWQRAQGTTPGAKDRAAWVGALQGRYSIAIACCTFCR